MTNPTSTPQSCTAFDGHALLARGALIDVALAVKGVLTERPGAAILVFDDTTGRVVDLDLRGTATEIAARHSAPAPVDPPGAAAEAPRGRGRPKLGVVAREVTLLPRHWDWLALQPGGASQALRRLVDDARKTDGGRSQSRAAQEAAYHFMSAMAGNLPGFEEASRALFATDRERFAEHASTWPADVRTYVEELAWGR